ncbi:MAG: hypothetical protein LV481_00195 [Methylacidiphilales bacterium]|nr:hypothetical protein [Candidatus Methylacidiphilales bacterium]
MRKWLGGLMSAWLSLGTAHAQVYVYNTGTGPGAYTSYISEYDTSGHVVNPAVVTGLDGGWGANSLAISGTNLIVGGYRGYIGLYPTSGGAANPNFITVPFNGVNAIAISGNNLYLSMNAAAGSGNVALYSAVTGALLNANLITNTNGGIIAAYADKLYVATHVAGSNYDNITQYAISGTQATSPVVISNGLGAPNPNFLDPVTALAATADYVYAGYGGAGRIGRLAANGDQSGTGFFPVLVDGYPNLVSTSALVVSGNLLYIADNVKNSVNIASINGGRASPIVTGPRPTGLVISTGSANKTSTANH